MTSLHRQLEVYSLAAAHDDYRHHVSRQLRLQGVGQQARLGHRLGLAVELEYDSGGKIPFKFTTEVSVVPDVLPFKFEDALKQGR